MADNKWSEEQPPEWTGEPIGSTPAAPQWQPPAGPPVPATAAQPARSSADLGGILRSVWKFLGQRLGLYVGGTAALTALAIAVSATVANALFPNGLSDEAIAILQGAETDLLNSDQMTQAQLEALMAVLGEVGTVALLTIVPVVLIQFVFGAMITRMALAQVDGQTISSSAALRSTPFAKVFSSGIALTVSFLALFVPLIFVMGIGALLGSIGILLIVAALIAFVAVIVWLGLGVTFITATVIDENIGFFASIRRSLSIAKGQRLIIFAATLIVSICASLPVNLAVTAITAFSEFSFLSYFGAAILPLVLAVPSTAVLSGVLFRAIRR